MTRIPFRPPNSDDSPRVRSDRRNVPRRPHQATAAALHMAQDYAAVGLPVSPLAPGDALQRNQCGKHEAATGADRIRVWRRRWLTASIGLRPLRVVCLTRRGQAT